MKSVLESGLIQRSKIETNLSSGEINCFNSFKRKFCWWTSLRVRLDSRNSNAVWQNVCYVQTFNFFSSTFQALLLAKNCDAAKMVQHNVKKLFMSGTLDGQTFQTLQWTVTVFSPIRYSQIKSEASNVPTLMKVVPVVKKFKLSLLRLFLGAHNFVNIGPLNNYVQVPVKQTAEVLNNVQYHKLWNAVCFLQLGLTTFSFCPRLNASRYKFADKELVKNDNWTAAAVCQWLYQLRQPSALFWCGKLTWFYFMVFGY